MSRSYQIRLPIEVLLSPASREKLGKYSMVFSLMGILPDERMKELLQEKLTDKNCSMTEEGLVLPCGCIGSAVFDVENLTLNLQVPVSDGMDMSFYSPDYMSYQEEEEKKSSMQRDVDKALASGEVLNDKMEKLARESLGNAAAIQLKALAMEARQIINEALKETYRDAINEKASQLGNVSNITENSEGATYRIRIEVES